jgi:hypothetical protein
MTMTPDAKRALSSTIRALRERLLTDLHAETERVYRLGVRVREAGLSEAAVVLRARLEDWLNEQVRAQGTGRGNGRGNGARGAEELLAEVVKQAAYTLLHRLVFLRLLEAPGAAEPGHYNGEEVGDSGEPQAQPRPPLRGLAVVTGGWQSRGYLDFRALAPGLCMGGGREDQTEGYAFLLELVFAELATELPGLYGPQGPADLVPVPAATLRAVVDALDAPELHSCFSDDMTLGWVYQYWNDPEREALDEKLNEGGKVEPHEIASKTQMFTERYMVDWLLQNSLGPLWLAMCQKNKWTPEVQQHGVLAALEERRTEWRAKRAAGEVALTELMPLHSPTERRWAYFVPQPIPQDAVERAPASLRDLRLIDPAVGSGHFLVVALEVLFALYQEEARHRGEAESEQFSPRAIVERILSHNLHGIDLDPRAVQIAAAALWLRGQQLAPGARPERLNLVASNLRLAGLPDTDPALLELRREVERTTGLPAALTDTVVQALRGADHLGSLLRVDAAVDAALANAEAELGRMQPQQQDLFGGPPAAQQRETVDRARAKASVLHRLEDFLSRHTRGDDLGLRLRGEQLAAGVRFVRMVREGHYHVVVANPPYQGTSKMAESKYIEQHYPLGKADLFAAFLLRGLELAREGGVSAMLTMRNWMFIKQYSGLRENILGNFDVRCLGDFAVGAFDEVPNDVLSVVVSVIHRTGHRPDASVAQQPTPPSDTSYDRARTNRKRAATLCHEGRHTFDPAALKVVPEWPLVYWWDAEMLRLYQSAPLIGDVAPARKGLCTGNDGRFLRFCWEVPASHSAWPPTIHGGKGRIWIEGHILSIKWQSGGLEQQVFGTISGGVAIRGPHLYFRRGVAFSMIGANFSARVHRYPSIFGNMGSSVFPEDLAGAVCAMNSTRAREILSSLNPGVHFEVGDVNRLPLFPIADAPAIFARVEAAFGEHEAHREPSVEFRRPGPSPWRHAQEWAQCAVDRPEGAPLPPYTPELDPEPATDHLSYAVGVALGRFGAPGSGFEGILDPTSATHAPALAQALPHGILFIDTTLAEADLRDSLGHPATAALHQAWATHRAAVAPQSGLREWLAEDFFKDVHRQMYENRPIHWPLSSASRTFVAWVNIHRLGPQTLRVLQADHLLPTLTRIDGELADLRTARDGADKKSAGAAEARSRRLTRARQELQQFMADVEQCADRGAPPTSAKCPAREQDARYAPNLDDGVMVNSAALWPLLDPQWKDPKKWYTELASEKDYDWAHLAMRHWPTRVDRKCQDDPSLAVAHGCFWRYHPERAWAWELRLQDEIGPHFRIEEAPYVPAGHDLEDPGHATHRSDWLAEYPEEAIAAIEKEALRRMGRSQRRRLVAQFELKEPGLWTNHPEALWDLELRLSEKQGSELRIQAPDEPQARQQFEARHPEKVRARATLLANLQAPPEMFHTQSEDESDLASVDPEEDQP